MIVECILWQKDAADRSQSINFVDLNFEGVDAGSIQMSTDLFQKIFKVKLKPGVAKRFSIRTLMRPCR